MYKLFLLSTLMIFSCSSLNKIEYGFNDVINKEIEQGINILSKAYGREVTDNLIVYASGEAEFSILLILKDNLPIEFYDIYKKTDRVLRMDGRKRIPIIFRFDIYAIRSTSITPLTYFPGGYSIVFDSRLNIISKGIIL